MNDEEEDYKPKLIPPCKSYDVVDITITHDRLLEYLHFLRKTDETSIKYIREIKEKLKLLDHFGEEFEEIRSRFIKHDYSFADLFKFKSETISRTDYCEHQIKKYETEIHQIKMEKTDHSIKLSLLEKEVGNMVKKFKETTERIFKIENEHQDDQENKTNLISELKAKLDEEVLPSLEEFKLNIEDIQTFNEKVNKLFLDVTKSDEVFKKFETKTEKLIKELVVDQEETKHVIANRFEDSEKNIMSLMEKIGDMAVSSTFVNRQIELNTDKLEKLNEKIEHLEQTSMMNQKSIRENIDQLKNNKDSIRDNKDQIKDSKMLIKDNKDQINNNIKVINDNKETNLESLKSRKDLKETVSKEIKEVIKENNDNKLKDNEHKAPIETLDLNDNKDLLNLKENIKNELRAEEKRSTVRQSSIKYLANISALNSRELRELQEERMIERERREQENLRAEQLGILLEKDPIIEKDINTFKEDITELKEGLREQTRNTEDNGVEIVGLKREFDKLNLIFKQKDEQDRKFKKQVQEDIKNILNGNQGTIKQSSKNIDTLSNLNVLLEKKENEAKEQNDNKNLLDLERKINELEKRLVAITIERNENKESYRSFKKNASETKKFNEDNDNNVNINNNNFNDNLVETGVDVKKVNFDNNTNKINTNNVNNNLSSVNNVNNDLSINIPEKKIISAFRTNIRKDTDEEKEIDEGIN